MKTSVAAMPKSQWSVTHRSAIKRMGSDSELKSEFLLACCQQATNGWVSLWKCCKLSARVDLLGAAANLESNPRLFPHHLKEAAHQPSPVNELHIAYGPCAKSAFSHLAAGGHRRMSWTQKRARSQPAKELSSCSMRSEMCSWRSLHHFKNMFPSGRMGVSTLNFSCV